MELQYPGRKQEHVPKFPNINLLLGDNGAGKTTILRALALATLSPLIPQSGYVPYRMVRRTHPKDTRVKEATITAKVLLHTQDLNLRKLDAPNPETMAVKIVRHGEDYESLSSPEASPSSNKSSIWDNMYNDTSPAFLVLGYGASRHVADAKSLDESARRKARALRYERVASLFEPHLSLTPLSVWLPTFQKENPGRYKQVVHLIDRLLPEGASFAGEFEAGEFLLDLSGSKVPFGALSDGYRAYIGWIADLLYHVCMGAPSGAKLVDNYGLVLIDEIDLHLHPEWQRSVITTISYKPFKGIRTKKFLSYFGNHVLTYAPKFRSRALY